MLSRTIFLSSDFDTLDHNILSIGLNEIRIHSQVHSWFIYFIASRTSSLKINSSLSYYYVNIHGFPQGSVLGPIFIIYILPIKSIFHKYPNINYNLNANDLHIYSHFLVLVIMVLFKYLCVIVLLISLIDSLITQFP